MGLCLILKSHQNNLLIFKAILWSGQPYQVLAYCQTSDLGLRLEVDIVFPLSQEQEQQEQQQEQPLTKIYRIELNLRSGI